MQITPSFYKRNFDTLKEDPFWNNDNSQEIKMHKIHAYPAKFPSFLISKAIKYAEDRNVDVTRIGDIFCGCGTTALEARRADKDFYGYDINPVATLIAKVKSEKYNIKKLEFYFNLVKLKYDSSNFELFNNDDRIKYWFNAKQINDLSQLINCIKNYIPKGRYQNFFLCSFSNILKSTSNWLTKSIKPQIDHDKKPSAVWPTFEKQVQMMIKAVEENITNYNPTIRILNKNFLNVIPPNNFLDLLITSPPYVTSYEYADIHQLSSLWLGYTKDYRNLRNGSIGSLYHQYLIDQDILRLNKIGKDIYFKMLQIDKRKAHSIAKYFLDINESIIQAKRMVKNGGLLFFVIGNTSYKNIKIDNAKYLVECMLENGLANIEIFKRKISSKILTPYRDEKGKFSSSSTKREVYQYEFIITARKLDANN